MTSLFNFTPINPQKTDFSELKRKEQIERKKGINRAWRRLISSAESAAKAQFRKGDKFLKSGQISEAKKAFQSLLDHPIIKNISKHSIEIAAPISHIKVPSSLSLAPLAEHPLLFIKYRTVIELGRLESQAGNWDTALQHWTFACEYNSSESSNWFQKAKALYALSKIPDSRIALEHCLQISPDLLSAQAIYLQILYVLSDFWGCYHHLNLLKTTFPSIYNTYKYLLTHISSIYPPLSNDTESSTISTPPDWFIKWKKDRQEYAPLQLSTLNQSFLSLIEPIEPPNIKITAFPFKGPLSWKKLTLFIFKVTTFLSNKIMTLGASGNQSTELFSIQWSLSHHTTIPDLFDSVNFFIHFDNTDQHSIQNPDSDLLYIHQQTSQFGNVYENEFSDIDLYKLGIATFSPKPETYSPSNWKSIFDNLFFADSTLPPPCLSPKDLQNDSATENDTKNVIKPNPQEFVSTTPSNILSQLYALLSQQRINPKNPSSCGSTPLNYPTFKNFDFVTLPRQRTQILGNSLQILAESLFLRFSQTNSHPMTWSSFLSEFITSSLDSFQTDLWGATGSFLISSLSRFVNISSLDLNHQVILAEIEYDLFSYYNSSILLLKKLSSETTHFQTCGLVQFEISRIELLKQQHLQQSLFIISPILFSCLHTMIKSTDEMDEENPNTLRDARVLFLGFKLQEFLRISFPHTPFEWVDRTILTTYFQDDLNDCNSKTTLFPNIYFDLTHMSPSKDSLISFEHQIKLFSLHSSTLKPGSRYFYSILSSLLKSLKTNTPPSHPLLRYTSPHIILYALLVSYPLSFPRTSPSPSQESGKSLKYIGFTIISHLCSQLVHYSSYLKHPFIISTLLLSEFLQDPKKLPQAKDFGQQIPIQLDALYSSLISFLSTFLTLTESNLSPPPPPPLPTTVSKIPLYFPNQYGQLPWKTESITNSTQDPQKQNNIPFNINTPLTKTQIVNYFESLVRYTPIASGLPFLNPQTGAFDHHHIPETSSVFRICIRSQAHDHKARYPLLNRNQFLLSSLTDLRFYSPNSPKIDHSLGVTLLYPIVASLFSLLSLSNNSTLLYNFGKLVWNILSSKNLVTLGTWKWPIIKQKPHHKPGHLVQDQSKKKPKLPIRGDSRSSIGIFLFSFNFPLSVDPDMRLKYDILFNIWGIRKTIPNQQRSKMFPLSRHYPHPHDIFKWLESIPAILNSLPLIKQDDQQELEFDESQPQTISKNSLPSKLIEEEEEAADEHLSSPSSDFEDEDEYIGSDTDSEIEEEFKINLKPPPPPVSKNILLGIREKMELRIRSILPSFSKLIRPFSDRSSRTMGSFSQSNMSLAHIGRKFRILSRFFPHPAWNTMSLSDAILITEFLFVSYELPDTASSGTKFASSHDDIKASTTIKIRRISKFSPRIAQPLWARLFYLIVNSASPLLSFPNLSKLLHPFDFNSILEYQTSENENENDIEIFLQQKITHLHVPSSHIKTLLYSLSIFPIALSNEFIKISSSPSIESFDLSHINNKFETPNVDDDFLLLLKVNQIIQKSFQITPWSMISDLFSSPFTWIRSLERSLSAAKLTLLGSSFSCDSSFPEFSLKIFELAIIALAIETSPSENELISICTLLSYRIWETVCLLGKSFYNMSNGINPFGLARLVDLLLTGLSAASFSVGKLLDHSILNNPNVSKQILDVVSSNLDFSRFLCGHYYLFLGILTLPDTSYRPNTKIIQADIESLVTWRNSLVKQMVSLYPPSTHILPNFSHAFSLSLSHFQAISTSYPSFWITKFSSLRVHALQKAGRLLLSKYGTNTNRHNLSVEEIISSSDDEEETEEYNDDNNSKNLKALPILLNTKSIPRSSLDSYSSSNRLFQIDYFTTHFNSFQAFQSAIDILPHWTIPPLDNDSIYPSDLMYSLLQNHLLHAAAESIKGFQKTKPHLQKAYSIAYKVLLRSHKMPLDRVAVSSFSSVLQDPTSAELSIASSANTFFYSLPAPFTVYGIGLFTTYTISLATLFSYTGNHLALDGLTRLLVNKHNHRPLLGIILIFWLTTVVRLIELENPNPSSPLTNLDNLGMNGNSKNNSHFNLFGWLLFKDWGLLYSYEHWNSGIQSMLDTCCLSYPDSSYNSWVPMKSETNPQNTPHTDAHLLHLPLYPPTFLSTDFEFDPNLKAHEGVPVRSLLFRGKKLIFKSLIKCFLRMSLNFPTWLCQKGIIWDMFEWATKIAAPWHEDETYSGSTDSLDIENVMKTHVRRWYSGSTETHPQLRLNLLNIFKAHSGEQK